MAIVDKLQKAYDMDAQYEESMVFTPYDFQFPNNGGKAEDTPNTKMILITDVDLDLLTELHNFGSVTKLKDHQHDIYELKRTRR